MEQSQQPDKQQGALLKDSLRKTSKAFRKEHPEMFSEDQQLTFPRPEELERIEKSKEKDLAFFHPIHEIPLFNVNMHELLTIWADLVEAKAGINRYGGDTAEIYSYRFRGYDPTLFSPYSSEASKRAATRQQQINAANSLVQVCRMFEKTYDVQIRIEGLSIGRWRKEIGSDFSHRAHVTVLQRKRKK